MPAKEERQTMMFSATFPTLIQKLATDFLVDKIFLRVGRVGSTTEFIIQTVKYVRDDNKEVSLLDFLRSIKEGLVLGV